MRKLFFIIYAAVMVSSIGCGDTFYGVYNEFTGPVQKVEIRESASVVIDTTEQLYATVYPSMTDNKNVTWSSADPLIASVDGNGVVTGKILNGSTTITATTEDGGFTDECVVTVVPVPVSMQTLTLPSTQTIGTSQQRILTPVFTPAGATSIEMTWSSSNSSVATVEASPDGGRSATVTGVIEGTAVITVSSVHWGISASCTVTVGQPTYVVKYDANGGSGAVPVDNEEYKNGDPVLVSSGASLTKAGYTFSHWNTEKSGSGASRIPGTTYNIPGSDVTFYAQWTLSLPSAPAAPTLTEGDTQISISWSAVPFAASYEVWYRKDSDIDFTQKPDIITDTNYILTGLVNGTLYHIKLRAKNTTGTSDFSAEAIERSGISPTVVTTNIVGNLTFTVSIAGTSAVGGGNVTIEGTAAVTERGLCWNTTGSPTISDSKITAGSGSGEFTNAIMSSLTASTTYYVRAYATNAFMTKYGNEISFNSGKTLGMDYEGGYVFYNDGSGGGLVSTKTDNNSGATTEWITGNPAINTLNGNTSTSIGSGLANSNSIVAQTGHTQSAANICLTYSSGIYSDWYLPSKDELALLRSVLANTSAKRTLYSFSLSTYWSSSESTSLSAWHQTFQDTVNQYAGSKVSVQRVRAIRSF